MLEFSVLCLCRHDCVSYIYIDIRGKDVVFLIVSGAICVTEIKKENYLPVAGTNTIGT
jgi:hypothetical protein